MASSIPDCLIVANCCVSWNCASPNVLKRDDEFIRRISLNKAAEPCTAIVGTSFTRLTAIYAPIPRVSDNTKSPAALTADDTTDFPSRLLSLYVPIALIPENTAGIPTFLTNSFSLSSSIVLLDLVIFFFNLVKAASSLLYLSILVFNFALFFVNFSSSSLDKPFKSILFNSSSCCVISSILLKFL